MKIVLILIFILIHQVYAQQYNINGKVVDKKNEEPLLGVNILISELKTGTITDSKGEFHFKGINPGNYKLQFSYIGHKTVEKNISLEEDVFLKIKMVESAIDLDEVMITGNPLGSGSKDVAASAVKISNLDLQILRSSYLGEFLNFQPGIAKRSNGLTTGRPVIRGFSNNRVLILENGLRMGDLSNASDDHAIGSEGSEAKKIEILRGPSSLLYGSNAIGGVINIINEKIPKNVYPKIFGSVYSEVSSVNDGSLGLAEVGYGVGNLAFQSSYFLRNSGNYKTPVSTTKNSDAEAEGYHLGFSLLPKNFSSGISYSKYKTKYGIPFFEEEEKNGEEEGEGPILIDMYKDEFRFDGSLNNIKGAIKSVSLKVGLQKYKHQEISRSTGVIGTSFKLSTFSSDLTINHSSLFPSNEGIIGTWFQNQSYNVEGDEAFTPNADYSAFAFYLYEQARLNRINFQFGLRYERNNIDIPTTLLSDSLLQAEQKDFNSLSGSLGFVYSLSGSLFLFGNTASAFRAPSIEELSSYAVHEALGSFDIGNRKLKQEKNFGFDFGLRVKKDFHLVELNIFYNNLKNFIYRDPSEKFYDEAAGGFNFQSGIPVYEYRQSDAKIYGFETKARYEMIRTVSITIISDYVRGQLSNGNNLPQIPPLRFSIEPRFADDHFWSGFILKYAAEQGETARNESPTGSYLLLDLYAGIKFFTGNFIHQVNFKIDNVLNEKYRDHLSALKDFIYMPGRNIKLNYKFIF